MEAKNFLIRVKLPEIRRLTFTKRDRRQSNAAPNSNISVSGVALSSASDPSLPMSLSMEELPCGKPNTQTLPSSVTSSISSSTLPIPLDIADLSPKTHRLAALSIDENLPPLPNSPLGHRLKQKNMTIDLERLGYDQIEGISTDAAEEHEQRRNKKQEKRSDIQEQKKANVKKENHDESQDKDPIRSTNRQNRSPRLQWNWEIGSNRDRCRADNQSGSSDGSLHKSATVFPVFLRSKENRERYFLAEVGASARSLVMERSSNGNAHSSSSSSTVGSSNTLFVLRGIPPILPYLAIILRGAMADKPLQIIVLHIFFLDFIAVIEGNAPYHPDGRINSHLIELQYQIVDELKNFQVNSYNLPRKREIRRYLENLDYEVSP